MISVAIDGPAGAGKSSVAKALAGKLSFIYADTGALYRAVGLYMLKHGVDINHAESVEKEIKKNNITVKIKFFEDGQHVLLCGEDVSTEIRKPEVSMAASTVSAIAEVRKFLFELQRSIAESDNVIMDGRDIGTVVLPNADVKIFLTASAEERAKRRMLEQEQKGIHEDFEKILEDIQKRDFQDTNRAISPLKAASDSIVVDTSDMSFEEVLEELSRIIKEKTGI